jgi:hypothetical protein
VAHLIPLRDRLFSRLQIAAPPRSHDRQGRELIGPCLLWTGYIQDSGYAKISDKCRMRYVHRVAYDLLVGGVSGELDHLCRVRHCAAPMHMEDVTHRANVLRGDGWAAEHASKTHCPSGHEYTDDNTCRDWRGGRKCRTCKRNQYRELAGIPLDEVFGKDRTHCMNGHEWSEENTRWNTRSATDPTPCRHCRACQREQAYARRHSRISSNAGRKKG